MNRRSFITLVGAGLAAGSVPAYLVLRPAVEFTRTTELYRNYHNVYRVILSSSDGYLAQFLTEEPDDPMVDDWEERCKKRHLKRIQEKNNG